MKMNNRALYNWNKYYHMRSQNQPLDITGKTYFLLIINLPPKYLITALTPE